MAGRVVRPEQFVTGVPTPLIGEQAVRLDQTLAWADVTILEANGPGQLILNDIKNDYGNDRLEVAGRYVVDPDHIDAGHGLVEMAKMVRALKVPGTKKLQVTDELIPFGTIRPKYHGQVVLGGIGQILISRRSTTQRRTVK